MRRLPPAEAKQTSLAPPRRLVLRGGALLVALIGLLSCMGEPTSPTESAIRYASGLSFDARFPDAMLQHGIADLVPFERVRILLRRTDGTVANDTTIGFSGNANGIAVALKVRLSPGAPATGEPMTLALAYVNSGRDTVFRGGPVNIMAIPSRPGGPPQAPISIDVTYSGVGATAKGVRISPRTMSVNAGSSFTFNAVAVDETGKPIPNTPIVWTSLDAARASIPNPLLGTGVALNLRGSARIVATLLNGKADTALVSVNLPPTTIAVVSGSGQTGIVGKPMRLPLPEPLVVKVTAADGLGVSGVTVNFAAANGGSVSSAAATTDANGVAQAGWTLGPIAGPQTATATVPGLAGSPLTFSATARATVATKLAFTTSPTAGALLNSGATIGLVVTAQDIDGDPVSSFTGNVSLSIATNPSNGTLSGTTSVNAVAGVATFPNVSIAQLGNGYVLRANATGLAAASTQPFNIISGIGTSLVLAAGGELTAVAGATLPPITVLVTDAAGSPRPGAVVNFAVASGGGSVTPVSTVTDATGRALATWTLGPTPGVQRLTVSCVGLTPLTVSATALFNQQLVITQQPRATQTAGVAVTPALVVQIKNLAGQRSAMTSEPVSIAIGMNPGGAALGGVTTVNTEAGVATFSNFNLNRSGTGYTIVVSAAGAASATSNAFTVSAAAASALMLQSGNNQSAKASTPLAQPIVAKVTDAFGNSVAGREVTFAVTAGGGSVTPTSTITNANGLASANWTIGPQGAQTLSISSTGLTGSPLTATATIGTGSSPSMTITPRVDTLTSITDTRTIAAQRRDAAGNILPGNWTWMSRTPSVATVNSSGVVTSIGNGTAVIVAIDASGARDSCAIIVQQRIAAITVNPSSRALYPSGRFAFTAQGVDRRGVALMTQPTFTWSSTEPSVATVDAATGVAAAVTLGATQIRATSGSTVGVSSVNVITPITRIDVMYDATSASTSLLPSALIGAAVPDRSTITSLGSRRTYRAIARDTLLNPMTGIVFTWLSTNPSVAIIDSTTETTARATAVGNGVSNIQASVQGVTGSATLTVAQAVSSIELSPTAATVGVAGTITMIARGKDATGHDITGGSFTYRSSAPAVATINPTTGVVTGVANGTATITAASGSITSNSVVVSVTDRHP